MADYGNMWDLYERLRNAGYDTNGRWQGYSQDAGENPHYGYAGTWSDYRKTGPRMHTTEQEQQDASRKKKHDRYKNIPIEPTGIRVLEEGDCLCGHRKKSHMLSGRFIAHCLGCGGAKDRCTQYNPDPRTVVIEVVSSCTDVDLHTLS